ncbi:MAG TPA: uroporphyrinogen-III C-methyltransferase [Candidatus Dormibacteraeota bacterium]|nr:uroporphyrinogen-III C-methyltransferase [Candidatus Dormibacteraeota bacterium]
MKAKVYLVGAGPGDPDLLTVKAQRLLQSAGAVLYDDLVSPEILSLIPSTAQLHNVGKRCGTKKITQEEINFLMVALADSGLQVVRLKSGDPLLFGRAGEEIESLRKAGVPCEIVPGVTSALGAAAAAQIPLTHRRVSSALVFLTAHQASESEGENWSRLVSNGSTLVIYMPGQNFRETSAKLRAAGLGANTPCALISRATTSRQRTFRTTIGELPLAPRLAAPTLLVVGEVVRFADSSVLEEFVLPASDAGIAYFPSHATATEEESIA